MNGPKVRLPTTRWPARWARWGCSESARAPVVHGDRAAAERLRRDQLEPSRAGQPALNRVGPWPAILGWMRNSYSSIGFETPITHICFRAPTRAAVRAFHAAALGAGAKDDGGPGVRHEYHDAYYATSVLSPEGHNIEAVCFEDEC
jgi:hypothetical protein